MNKGSNLIGFQLEISPYSQTLVKKFLLFIHLKIIRKYYPLICGKIFSEIREKLSEIRL